jgi:hypothetical protein
MVEVYTVYIYNVVESNKNPIYHIFMVDFYIYIYMKHSKKKSGIANVYLE